jgi:hypothetical protein
MQSVVLGPYGLNVATTGSVEVREAVPRSELRPGEAAMELRARGAAAASGADPSRMVAYRTRSSADPGAWLGATALWLAVGLAGVGLATRRRRGR